MSERQKQVQETVKPFEGKTISKIDASAANMWTVYFTDGTFLSLETEYAGHGIYAIAPDLKNQASSDT
jgi:hypothetical protein